MKLIAADGNRSAYDRIRKGGQYQVVTVSEPIELQAYQAIDELNRAFHGEPPSGFVQPPFLVTKENIHSEGGDQNTFIPSNDYKKHYLEIWGVEVAARRPAPAGQFRLGRRVRRHAEMTRPPVGSDDAVRAHVGAERRRSLSIMPG